MYHPYISYPIYIVMNNFYLLNIILYYQLQFIILLVQFIFYFYYLFIYILFLSCTRIKMMSSQMKSPQILESQILSPQVLSPLHDICLHRSFIVDHQYSERKVYKDREFHLSSVVSEVPSSEQLIHLFRQNYNIVLQLFVFVLYY